MGTGSDTANVHGYHIIGFDADGFQYEMVSDMEDAELQRIASQIGK